MPCSTQYLVVPPADAGGLNDKVRCIKLYKGKLLKYCAYISFTYFDIVDIMLWLHMCTQYQEIDINCEDLMNFI